MDEEDGRGGGNNSPVSRKTRSDNDKKRSRNRRTGMADDSGDDNAGIGQSLQPPQRPNLNKGTEEDNEDNNNIKKEKKKETNKKQNWRERRNQGIDDDIGEDSSGEMDDEERPGAVAVPGVAQPTSTVRRAEEEDDEVNSNSNYGDNVPVAIEAELATGDPMEMQQLKDEKEALQRELEQERENRIGAAEAEVILGEEESKKPGRFAMAVFVLIAVVVAVVLGVVLSKPKEDDTPEPTRTPTPSPLSQTTSPTPGGTESYAPIFPSESPSNAPSGTPTELIPARSNALMDIFVPISGEPAFADFSSPQSYAVQILARDNPDIVPIDESNLRPLYERYALLVLLFATNPGSWRWNNFYSFMDANLRVCDWNGAGLSADFVTQSDQGVQCLKGTDIVVQVNLDSNNLYGTLPSELSLLSSLQILSLAQNSISGPIPSEIGMLTGLQELRLKDNNLYGPVPSSISNLGDLKLLSLASNEISGTFPSDIHLLRNLEEIRLDDNLFNGILPLTRIYLIPDLLIVSAEGNLLSGSIPTELGLAASLRELRLSRNNIEGSLPSELRKLENLQVLAVSQNSVSGALPGEIGEMTSLRELWLNENNLAGPIPAGMQFLENLRILSLSKNSISGLIPNELGFLDSLEEIRLDYNNLTGSPPSELNMLTNLKIGLFESNQLLGELDICHAGLTRLVADCRDQVGCACCTSCCEAATEECYLPFNRTSSNDVRGFLIENLYSSWISSPGSPYLLAKDWILDDTLDISDSGLFLERYILALFYFQTSNTGSNPWRSCNPPQEGEDDLCIFEEFTRLPDDSIVFNPTPGVRWLSGLDVCEWVGVECAETSKVSGIKLFGQRLSGRIPDALTHLNGLERITLPYNELTGTIPAEWADFESLQILEIHGNLLTGFIPDTFDEDASFNLLTLNIGENLFSGTIDTRFGLLRDLRSFHLFENNFDGTFPTEIGFLNNLIFMRMNDNDFSGQVPTQLGQLRKLEELWWHENRFTGQLPSQLGNMEALKDLRFYFNDLTGPIPEEIYDLDLLYISLQDMSLTGTISTRIGQLTNLVFYRVSFNQLTGTIPVELANLPKLRLGWFHLNLLEGELPIDVCDNVGPGRLEFLQADCFPVENPPVPCVCCSACCDRDTRVCLLNE